MPAPAAGHGGGASRLVPRTQPRVAPFVPFACWTSVAGLARRRPAASRGQRSRPRRAPTASRAVPTPRRSPPLLPRPARPAHRRPDRSPRAATTGGSCVSPGPASTTTGTSGSGAGRGRRSAVWISARPSSAAEYRSAGSGRPARSTTAASGPRSADTGSSLSIRFMRVATVVSAANGTLPGHRLDQHEGQRVDVALAVDGEPLGLLGRRVAGRAQHDAGRLGPGRLGEGPGQPEVGDAQAAVVVEQEVGRLDVTVDEAPPVGVVEARGRRRGRPAAPARARAAGCGRASNAGSRRSGTR